jgi:hypothetical protein
MDSDARRQYLLYEMIAGQLTTTTRLWKYIWWERNTALASIHGQGLASFVSEGRPALEMTEELDSAFLDSTDDINKPNKNSDASSVSSGGPGRVSEDDISGPALLML